MWLFLQWLPFRGYNVTPLRQFPVLLRRSALCSNLSNFLDQVSDFPPGRTVVLPVFLRAFFHVTASLLFVRPTNVVRSFLHPSSFHDQLPHHMAMLMCPWVVGLPSQFRRGSYHTPSFKTPHSCLAVHFFQQAILACFSSIFFTSCGQTTLMSTATCPSNSKVQHSGH